MAVEEDGPPSGRVKVYVNYNALALRPLNRATANNLTVCLGACFGFHCLVGLGEETQLAGLMTVT